jgi:uncharacterized protein
MIIQLSKMEKLREPLMIEDRMNIEALIQSRREIQRTKPLDIRLEARNQTDGTIEVTGTMKTEMEMTCSRCLTEIKRELDMTFHERFTQNSEEANTEDHDDEQNEIHFVSSDTLDLTPFIEENVQLQLPFIPLCDEQCKGLCAACGTNLNEKSCECDTAKIDPRLAGLADLKKQMFDSD